MDSEATACTLELHIGQHHCDMPLELAAAGGLGQECTALACAASDPASRASASSTRPQDGAPVLLGCGRHPSRAQPALLGAARLRSSGAEIRGL